MFDSGGLRIAGRVRDGSRLHVAKAGIAELVSGAQRIERACGHGVLRAVEGSVCACTCPVQSPRISSGPRRKGEQKGGCTHKLPE